MALPAAPRMNRRSRPHAEWGAVTQTPPPPAGAERVTDEDELRVTDDGETRVTDGT